jgi:putative DNA primase/helicase
MFDSLKNAAAGQSFLDDYTENEKSTIGQQAEASIDAAPESTTDAIARLAKLTALEYDNVRDDEAKRLGVRVTTLDKEVSISRHAKSGDGGKSAMFTMVEPWSAAVDAGDVLNDIFALVKRFIACSDDTAIAVSLWIAFTWFIDRVQVAPLAVITAPEKRCGKTQLLTLIGKLCYRPLLASNIAPAAVYRVIEAHAPTMLLDETDSFLKDNEELRGVINSGHTRDSAYVIRCVGDDHEPRQFSTWGAKALSGIGHLSGTLMDRAVVLELRRKLATETVSRLRHADPLTFSRIASKLARLASDNGDVIEKSQPSLPEKLNDRAQDNWEPLLSVADLAGGEWPKKARDAALKLSGADQEEVSLSVELLLDIKAVFDKNNDTQITTAGLLQALIEDDQGPWATYNRGKSLTPRQLSKRLSEYDIHSINLKLGYQNVKKGFLANQFTDAFCRYLPPATTPSNHPLPATFQQPQGLNGSGKVAASDFIRYPLPEETQKVADGSATESLAATSEPLLSKEGSGVADKTGGIGGVCEVFL